MHKTICALLLLAILTTGCETGLTPESRFAGTWQLQQVETLSETGYKTLVTGYETGLLTLLENGNAEYRKNNLLLQGCWSVLHDDEFAITSMWVNLNLGAGGPALNWFFDDACIGGNGSRMDGYMNTTLPRYRYFFIRQ